VDALYRLDIDSLKIQEEEVLTLLSGSENNSISNNKLTIPMHTALIFKEQPNVKGLREKGLAHLITQYNILKGTIFFVAKITNKIYIPRRTTKITVLVP
jgi:hypothetical protein